MPFNDPSFRDTQGGGARVLLEPLVFTRKMGKGRIEIEVPAGFVSDLASVPRLLWCIFPPFGKFNRAAILHDFLYSTAGECSRFLADAIFREAMAELSVPAWRRVLMFYAVRWFGWAYFNAKGAD